MFRYTVVFETLTGNLEFPVTDKMEIKRAENESGEIIVECGGDCQATGIVDFGVSRRHVCLYFARDKLFVRDMGSLNGTKLDGNLLRGWKKKRPSEAVCIESRCEMEIGDTRARVEVIELASPPVPPLVGFDPELLKKLLGLPAEIVSKVLLLMATDPAQQKYLADLARDEIHSAQSVDKILALRFTDRPHLAQHIEKFLTAVSTNRKEDAEKLISEIKENAAIQKEMDKHKLEELSKLFEQFIGAVPAVAGGGVVPTGPAKQFCPRCGGQSAPGQAFCLHCGQPLK